MLNEIWKYVKNNWEILIGELCITIVVSGIGFIGYMMYCEATPKIERPCMITITDLNGKVLHKYYGQVRWIKHHDKPVITIEYNHDFK